MVPCRGRREGNGGVRRLSSRNVVRAAVVVVVNPVFEVVNPEGDEVRTFESVVRSGVFLIRSDVWTWRTRRCLVATDESKSRHLSSVLTVTAVVTNQRRTR